MPRPYTVVFENVAIAASQDLFEVDAAAEKPIAITGLFLSQFTAEGDANEDYWRWSIIRGHTTGGSGGTAPTPRPLRKTDPAAGFTAEVNNTTIASAGTAVTLHQSGWNIRSDLPFWVPEGLEADTSGADLLVVRLHSTPDASTTCSGTLYVIEYG